MFPGFASGNPDISPSPDEVESKDLDLSSCGYRGAARSASRAAKRGLQTPVISKN
jgi:hypothetical protein